MKKFAFYVSNQANIFILLLTFIRKSNFSDFKQVSFVFIDGDPSQELQDLCSAFGLKIIAKKLSVYPHKERGRVASDYISILLDEYHIDFLFILCNKILSGPLLSKYHNRIINTHPAVLPSFKGAKAIDQALAAKAFLLGLTVHFIDENLDAGIPILQTVRHHSFFKGDYMTVLGDSIIAILQVMKWLSDDRISMNSGYAFVEGADYSSSRFIPALEELTLIRSVEN